MSKKKIKFKRPSKKIIDLALKIKDKGLSKKERSYYRYKNLSSFKEIPIPGRDDWLANFKEKGQTFDTFVVQSRTCSVPDEKRRTMYVQPIGSFNGPRNIDMSVIEEYMDCFFDSLNTKILPPMTMTEASQLHPLVARKRSNNKYTQLQTFPIFEFLKKCRKLNFGFEDRGENEIISIALLHPYDLFPEEDWNFVFGQADTEFGIGAYSLARFDPLFPNIEVSYMNGSIQKFSKEELVLVMKRNLQTLTHEILHLFGLDHCVYFSCLMNGSNHLEEADKAPLFLCPVCLRKLHKVLEFDFGKRYLKIKSFFERYGLKEEEEWIEKRLNEVN